MTPPYTFTNLMKTLPNSYLICKLFGHPLPTSMNQILLKDQRERQTTRISDSAVNGNINMQKSYFPTPEMSIVWIKII